jgi:uncharacterized Tic20 family protein
MTHQPPAPDPSATNPPVLPPPTTPDERTWCVVAHVSAIVAMFVLAGLAPVGPLIVYLIKKDESPVIRAHAAEALNFQLSVFIGVIIGYVLVVIFIGFLILAAAAVVGIVFAVIAAITVNKGEGYRYPFALRLVN